MASNVDGFDNGSERVTVLDGFVLRYPTSIISVPDDGKEEENEALIVCEQSGHCIVQFDPYNNQNLHEIAVIVGSRNKPASNMEESLHSKLLNEPVWFAFSRPPTCSPIHQLRNSQRSNSIAGQENQEATWEAYPSIYIGETVGNSIKRFDFTSRSLEFIAGVNRSDLIPELPSSLRPWEVWSFGLAFIAINDDASLLAMTHSITEVLVLDLLAHRYKYCIYVGMPDIGHCVEFLGDGMAYIGGSYGVHIAIFDLAADINAGYWDSNSQIQEFGINSPFKLSSQLVCGSTEQISGFRDGPKIQALFDFICAMLMNSDRTKMYLSDLNNHRIRCWHFDSDQVTTLAGSGEPEIRSGSLETCAFENPNGLCWINHGDLVVTNSVAEGRICIISNVDENAKRNYFSSKQSLLISTISNNRTFTQP